MELGFRISQLRSGKQMTQGELAEKVGVSRVAIGNYERGDRMPTIDVAERIASALGVSTDYLINGESVKDNGMKQLSDDEVKLITLSRKIDQGDGYDEDDKEVFKKLIDYMSNQSKGLRKK